MRVVAFTPIRLNNQRCPGKNTRMLAGRPLLAHAVETVAKLGVSNHVYCSDARIVHSLPSGVELVIRTPCLDEDGVIGLDIYRAFAKAVPADLYMLYHVTSPFVPVETYAEGLDAVVSGEYDSALSVTKIQAFAWFRGMPLNFAVPRVQTQRLEPVVVENSAFYVFKREHLTQGRRSGDRPCFVELSPVEGLDIDTEADFAMAERMSCV